MVVWDAHFDGRVGTVTVGGNRFVYFCFAMFLVGVDLPTFGFEKDVSKLTPISHCPAPCLQAVITEATADSPDHGKASSVTGGDVDNSPKDILRELGCGGDSLVPKGCNTSNSTASESVGLTSIGSDSTSLLDEANISTNKTMVVED
ncbi:hypothetical protein V501_08023 [Pseudogymnoascus sp. VKM F-4519 (FW-2642)]|nr:hypothetical protein V501_08023 [Pseudogymnoascus sp. VKM F-4519 (FW-2642)]